MGPALPRTAGGKHRPSALTTTTVATPAPAPTRTRTALSLVWVGTAECRRYPETSTRPSTASPATCTHARSGNSLTATNRTVQLTQLIPLSMRIFFPPLLLSSSSSSSSSYCEEAANAQSDTDVREESTRLYPYESIVPETDLSADESHLHPTDPELFAARKDVLLKQFSGNEEVPSLLHDTVESLPATQYFSSPEEERAPNFSCSSITDVSERDSPAVPPSIFPDAANPTASPVPLQKNEGKLSNPQREAEVLKRDMLSSSPCQSLPSFGSPQCTPKTSTPHHQTACPCSLENKAPRFSHIHTAEATHHGTPSRPPPSTSPASTPRSSKVRIPNPGFQRPENWRQSAWEAYRHTRRTPSSMGRPAYLDLSVASYNRAASPSSVSVLLSPMMGVCSRRRRGAAEVLCSTMVGELSSSLSSLRPAAGMGTFLPFLHSFFSALRVFLLLHFCTFCSVFPCLEVFAIYLIFN